MVSLSGWLIVNCDALNDSNTQVCWLKTRQVTGEAHLHTWTSRRERGVPPLLEAAAVHLL